MVRRIKSKRNTKHKDTKRKNTKYKNTKRRNTNRRNTNRRNTKRRNTKRRNTKRRIMRGGSSEERLQLAMDRSTSASQQTLGESDYLYGLDISDLREIAIGLGITKDALNEADHASDARDAVIGLIIAKMTEPEPEPERAPASSAAETVNFDEVKDALRRLKANCDDTEFPVALRTLVTIVKNAFTHPEIPKLRRVRTENANFLARLGSKEGGVDALLAFGFTHNYNENDQEILQMTRTESAFVKSALTALEQLQVMFSEKIVLFLTLDSRLNDRAITRHVDLPEQIRAVGLHLDNFRVVEENFGYDQDIFEILSKYKESSIYHLVFVTHGSPNSLYFGPRQSIGTGTPEFDELCRLLNKILLPYSSILITACLTGKIYPAPDIRPDLLEIHQNCNYDNFANQLSLCLYEHKIFCTPEPQIQSEIGLYTSNDSEFFINDPMKLIYTSGRQIMYAFLHDFSHSNDSCIKTLKDAIGNNRSNL